MSEKTMAKSIFVQMTGGISLASHLILAATVNQMAREHEGLYTEYFKIILDVNVRQALSEKNRNWGGQQNLEYKHGNIMKICS